MDYFSLTSRLILPLTVSSLFLLAWSISLISCSSWEMDIEYLNNIQDFDSLKFNMPKNWSKREPLFDTQILLFENKEKRNNKEIELFDISRVPYQEPESLEGRDWIKNFMLTLSFSSIK